MARNCSSALKTSCFPLVLVLFLDSCSKIGLIKAMGILFQDVSRDLQMTATDLGIALGLFISIGNVASLYPLLASVTGLGNAIVRMPCLLLLSELANDNFNLLYSLSSCGYSVGMVIYPFFAEELLIAYGWRGVLLILAGVMFHEVPCLMAFKMPLEEIPTDDAIQDVTSGHHASINELQKEEMNSTCHQNQCEEADQTNEGSFASDRDSLLTSLDADEYKHEYDSIFDKNLRSYGCNPSSRSWTAGVGTIQKWYRGTLIYADPLSLFIFLSFAAVQYVTCGWVSFLVPQALQRGLSIQNISLLTSCAAFGGVFGRVAVAFLTHKLVRPIDMFLFMIILNALALVTDACISNLFAMMFTAFCTGLSTSARSNLGHLVIRDRVSADHLAMSMAFLEVVGGIAVFLGGYTTGEIAEVFSSYDASFKVLALGEVLTFPLLLPVRMVKRQDQPNSSTNQDMDIENVKGE
ncbi:uncharacterized protein LOC121413276 [Lytechinus variegatus]|uniref:uncharacterized protein LOC121413276 n=1 Tax=Lytechinus variegatus TaxID=7654 RepID=UPI001BB1AF7D|nr:uncharacterized protein LOC121413276 [Lytechinus variegatus]